MHTILGLTFILFFTEILHYPLCWFSFHSSLYHWKSPSFPNFFSAVQVIENITDDNDDQTSSKSRRKRSFSCDVGHRRMRRSCVIIPPPPPSPATVSPMKILVADNLGFDGKFFFPNQTPNYNLTMFESSCLYWDEDNETWAGHGCRVRK